ncbi:MAG: L-ribulose-5-phosphate 3-epimerase [Treponema sp.]|nr:L-ribulose-5-phosphate 3-epimerase [Treponema sp.]
MKLYQLGLYEKSMPGFLGIPQKLKETGESGFDYLELSIDETDEKLSRLDWDTAEIKKLNNCIDDYGVPIKSICLSGHRRFPLGDPDPQTRGRSMEIMEKAIILSSRLGAAIIQLAGYDVYYKPSAAETQKWFAQNLELCVRLAAREGIILAFETMETPFINTVEKAMAWVRKCNSPYLQVYPDIGNITNACLEYSINPGDDLKSGAGHIAALHLKESKPGIYREVPYGQGHVNFGDAIETAWKLGTRLFVAEFWYGGNQQSWQNQLRENNKFLRKFLDDASR